jgi:hypothetical protein
VVDGDNRLLGIVSEADLMRRAELGTDKHRSWWLELLTSDETRAGEFVKTHAAHVRDVMTQNVVTATENASFGDIADLLERHGIKRVPIVCGYVVVGIVSRSSLLQAFATATVSTPPNAATLDDRTIRERVMAYLLSQPWGRPWLLTVTVSQGVVGLWGPVNSEDQRRAIRVAAETTPGMKAVKDKLYKDDLFA